MLRPFAALLSLFAALQLSEGAVGVYDIGNIRPEGIHVLPEGAAETMGLGSDGTFALVSEFYYGGIKAVNLETGAVTQIVDSLEYGERGTIGLWYDSGVILACSGGAFVGEDNDAAIYVFDASTGDELAKCLPEGGGMFLNDVTVIDGTAYATDSFKNSIMTLDVEAAKNGECVVSSIETPADIFLSQDVWSANGIIPYGSGLLIAHETNGGVYFLDLSDTTVSEVIPVETLVFADGLCIDNENGILYVAQNDVPGPLTAWEMTNSNGGVSAAFIGTIESSDYDSPATCDVSGDNVYSPNARFGIGLPAEGEDDPSTFVENFQVVGVHRFESFSPTTPPPVDGPAPPTQSPGQCQTVMTQEGFDLDTYISARWYSQQQRPSPFQPATLNYCTTADYSKIDHSSSNFIDAYTIKVFNTAQDVDGNVFTSDDKAQVGPDPGPLCGLQPMPDADPAKLLVGNCFDDPAQPFGAGPYWVLEYDETIGYALISGGQPDVPTESGLCTYSSPFSGLWIFTRDSQRNDALIEEVRDMAIAQGIDPSSMLDVNQENCVYPEAPTPAPTVVTLSPKNYDGCMKVNGDGEVDDEFMLATCDESDLGQQFIFEGNQLKLALDETKCAQAGRVNPQPSHGHFLRVFSCDSSKPQQQFTWNAPDGALTLVQFPSLAVVFQGVTANVNKDRIIVGDLSRQEVDARKDWVIFK